MKAFITGAGGQVGSELRAILPGAIAADHAALDVSNEDSVWKALTNKKIDVVFHTAAMTDVDACERDPASARRVNALGTRNLACVCGTLGIYLVALSTDYVFDGRGHVDHYEDAATKPISVYGKSKLEGEIAVAENCPQGAVVRTSWVYGSGRRNFVRKVLERASTEEYISMVTHQVSTPTWARDLAPALVKLARRRPAGTFHLTNDGHASRYEWARAIVELAGMDPERVHPIQSVPTVARRPGYSVLANRRARSLGISLRPWYESLAEFIAVDGDISTSLATVKEPVA
jgi:dTDP-4-dehydrorhamnose reductase